MFIFVLFLFFSVSGVQSRSNGGIDLVETLQNFILRTINETAPDFELCNENLLEKASFGDMIEIKRRGYFHWSTFVGNKTVLNLKNLEFDKLNIRNAFNNFKGQVELRNLIDLAGKDFCRINNKVNESKQKGLQILPDSELIKKMEEELQQNMTVFNTLDYNCEHFAAKLKFGVSFSSQVGKRINESICTLK